MPVAEVGSLARLLPEPRERLIPIPAALAADGQVLLAIRFHRVGWLSDAAGAGAGPFEGVALLGCCVPRFLRQSRLAHWS